MKSKLIVYIALVLSSITFAQDYGYLGNKNSVTLTGTFSPRFISNLIAKNQPVNAKAWPVTFGGSFRFEHQLSMRNFIGLEFGYSNTASRIPYGTEVYIYSDKYPDLIIKADLLAHKPFRYNVFAPAITYSRAYSGNLAPIGIVNTIGGGVLIAKPVQKDYEYLIDTEYIYGYYPADPADFPGATEDLQSHIISSEFYDKILFGLRFFWQTSLNVPLAPHVMWTTSVRGNVNIYTPLLFERSSSDYHMINYDRMRRSFSVQEALNVLEISTGIKITF